MPADASTPTPPVGALRLKGIQFAPPKMAGELERELTALRDATSRDRLNLSKLRRPSLPAWPVFHDADGKTFTIESDAIGQTFARETSIGSLHDLADGPPGAGQFVRAEDLTSMSAGLEPDANGAIAAGMTKIILQQQSPRRASAPQVAADDVSDTPAEAPAGRNPILDQLQALAIGKLQQKGAEALAGMLSGGSALDVLAMPTISDLAGGLLSAGIGQALDFGAQAVLSALFPVDDTSSGGEFLGAEAAKQLMDALKGEAMDAVASLMGGGGAGGDSLAGQIEDTLGTPKAGFPLARTGDLTAHGGTVVGGTAMTLVGGVAIARATDQQVCPIPGPPPHKGGPIRQGNPNVVIETQLAAAYTHEAICEGCGLVTPLMPLGMDVEIGTDVADVLPKPLPKVPPPLPTSSPAPPATKTGASTTEKPAGKSPTGEAGEQDSTSAGKVAAGTSQDAPTANGSESQGGPPVAPAGPGSGQPASDGGSVTPVQAENGDWVWPWDPRASWDPVDTTDQWFGEDHPVHAGMEWLTGEGERNREYSDGDQFTEMLRHDEHISNAREQVMQQLASGDQRALSASGQEFPRKLGGLNGVKVFVGDVTTLVTFGQVGNLATTYLGSFNMNVRVSDIDPASRTAVLNYTVHNTSSIGSLAKPPWIGYTDFWRGYIEPHIQNLIPSSGPLSKTTQTIRFKDVVRY